MTLEEQKQLTKEFARANRQARITLNQLKKSTDPQEMAELKQRFDAYMQQAHELGELLKPVIEENCNFTPFFWHHKDTNCPTPKGWGFYFYIWPFPALLSAFCRVP